ncbi:YrhK family protein [Chelativorans sp. M5D2P16]|uniref:YrhK family protein n=1 Tax=Chelativorans sp. M5D2P16 TaxID=3095678 RepID=UPI002AC9FE6C|nr:YrhK family protein [Chelativorans sp. M5D2P16]MDZ5699720.1 YrhK family protein [Chelativorans sp. M5D2P16]
MKIFNPSNPNRSCRHRKLYAYYEIGYTVAEFAAAMLFFVGSVLFLYPAVETPAIWCFIIGSAFFALKPSIRVVRELHYLAIGDYTDLEGAGQG